jgi:hypothetical protein
MKIDLLVAHHDTAQVGKLMREVSARFSDKSFEVQMTFNRRHPPFRLVVQKFFPKTEEASQFVTIKSQSPHHTPGFEDKYPWPLALKDMGKIELEEKCREYIEILVRHQRDVLKTALHKSTNKICMMTLQAIVHFQRLKPSSGTVSPT